MEQEIAKPQQNVQTATTCYLKWFNTAKGFGFVVPEGATDDVFLHASILQRGGHPIIGKGALLSCVVDKSDNGYFVKDVLKIIQPGECPFAKSDEEIETLGEHVVRGLVKWYDEEKEFGFIIPDDGVKDIFIHKSCLESSDLETLVAGQSVIVTYKPVLKGREALTVKVVENP
ncbi:MAG: cold shock domain-containing protein [Bdellovibrionales bacterium]